MFSFYSDYAKKWTMFLHLGYFWETNSQLLMPKNKIMSNNNNKIIIIIIK